MVLWLMMACGAELAADTGTSLVEMKDVATWENAEMVCGGTCSYRCSGKNKPDASGLVRGPLYHHRGKAACTAPKWDPAECGCDPTWVPTGLGFDGIDWTCEVTASECVVYVP